MLGEQKAPSTKILINSESEGQNRIPNIVKQRLHVCTTWGEGGEERGVKAAGARRGPTLQSE